MLGCAKCDLKTDRQADGIKKKGWLDTMKAFRSVPHFDKVDKPAIEAQFFDERRHRASLRLPFFGRGSGKTLCVIGQNPSAADDQNADMTVRYLEELIYRTRPEYKELLVLNLYSRVDTSKLESASLLDSRCAKIFDDAIKEHQEFLLVYGKLRNERAYKFPARAGEVSLALKGKNVLKLDLSTSYPPHPGNPKILYSNYNVRLVQLQSDDS